MPPQTTSGHPGEGVTSGGIGDSELLIGLEPAAEILKIDPERDHAELIRVKYSNHSPSDPAIGDRPADDYTRVTLLVAGGPWEQRMWNPENDLDVTYRLDTPGDFIAWQPGVMHSWKPLGDATMVTITYRFTKKESPEV